MKIRQILILAFFGDPTLSPGTPNAGGFNQTLKELLVFFATLPLDFVVITDTISNSSALQQAIASNIEIHRINISSEEQRNQNQLFYATSRIVNDVIDIMVKHDIRPCLVHSFYWFSGYIAQKLNQLYGFSYIHTVISLSKYKLVAGVPAKNRYQLDCENSFLPGACCILAITPTESLFLQHHYKVDRQKIIVIGRSVDDCFYKPSHDENGLPYTPIKLIPQEQKVDILRAEWWFRGAFLFIGRMVPIKGVDNIILAWSSIYAKYRELTPPIWIVGGTPDMILSMRQCLLEKGVHLEEYENAHKLVWWGYLNSASISTLLLNTRTLVTHSKYEPGGRVLLEAMCQGVPIIATPNGFANDYIKNWDNGFLVNYGDIDRLARCMEYFLLSPLLSHTMGKRAKRCFHQLETEWNYFEIHRLLYTTLGNAKEICYREQQEEIPIGTFKDYPYEVTQYPYCNIRVCIKDLINKSAIKINTIDENAPPVQIPSNNARCYFVNTKGQQLVFKQYFNQLNQSTLWNTLDTTPAFFATELAQKAKSSIKFKKIFPLVFSIDEDACIVMKRATRPAVNRSIEEDVSILHLFSSPYICPIDFKVNTACLQTCSAATLTAEYRRNQNYWKCNRFESYTLEIGIATMNYHAMKYQIWPDEIGANDVKRLFSLTDKSRAQARYGTNYGKNISDHIVLFKNDCFLLPTDSWYYGELGLDIITRLIDEKKGEYLCTTQRPYLSIGHLRLLLWQIYYLWREMYRASWFGTAIDPYLLQLVVPTKKAIQRYA